VVLLLSQFLRFKGLKFNVDGDIVSLKFNVDGDIVSL